MASASALTFLSSHEYPEESLPVQVSAWCVMTSGPVRCDSEPYVISLFVIIERKNRSMIPSHWSLSTYIADWSIPALTDGSAGLPLIFLFSSSSSSCSQPCRCTRRGHTVSTPAIETHGDCRVHQFRREAATLYGVTFSELANYSTWNEWRCRDANKINESRTMRQSDAGPVLWS